MVGKKESQPIRNLATAALRGVKNLWTLSSSPTRLYTINNQEIECAAVRDRSGKIAEILLAPKEDPEERSAIVSMLTAKFGTCGSRFFSSLTDSESLIE